ncbi:MAG: hypothetical protein HDS16_04840 [Bacteroides sp.]|nr:hypothetical protein [Bacteroides sp.]
MYSFQSDNINLCVSAKHRCYAKTDFVPNLKHGQRLRNRKRTTSDNIRLAESIAANCYIPRSGYTWKTENPHHKQVIIPGCEIGKNQYSVTKTEDISVDLDVWLKFFGLWLADGCTTRGGSTGYVVSIKQFGDNRKKVHEILKSLPFDYSESKENSRDASNFNIYSKHLYLYLLPFGKSTEKYIPRWILDLPTEKLKIFWDAYTFGDSTRNGNGLKISSVSERLIQGLQEIALKLGVICQVRYQTHQTWSNGLWSFQFNPNSRNIKYANKKIVRDYNGKVWCLTLKTNSVFLVRRKGIITFSGNCLGNKAYASNPSWYIGGDNKNGESELAGKQFFDTDKNFRPAEFMHFCSKMLVKEPKEAGKAPCMIIFCAFDQQMYFIELGKRYGFKHYINLVFRKNYSPQVLKANMKIVGNCEYGVLLYRDKLPKFNNDGQMIFNCIDYPRDNQTPKVHPTQKSVPLLEFLIRTFTDENDVVIDPCAGSGTTLLAAKNLRRRAYGFEIKKDFCAKAEKLLSYCSSPVLF